MIIDNNNNKELNTDTIKELLKTNFKELAEEELFTCDVNEYLKYIKWNFISFSNKYVCIARFYFDTKKLQLKVYKDVES